MNNFKPCVSIQILCKASSSPFLWSTINKSCMYACYITYFFTRLSEIWQPNYQATQKAWIMVLHGVARTNHFFPRKWLSKPTKKPNWKFKVVMELFFSCMLIGSGSTFRELSAVSAGSMVGPLVQPSISFRLALPWQLSDANDQTKLSTCACSATTGWNCRRRSYWGRYN